MVESSPTPYDIAHLFGVESSIFYAWFLRDYIHPEKNLKVVYGSLGIGKKKPFFDYGGPGYRTVADFLKLSIVDHETKQVLKWDMHTWLEDDQDNVYDMCVPDHSATALARGRELDFPPDECTEIKGVSKDELAAKGLFHLPAPLETQRILGMMVTRQLGSAYQECLKHVPQLHVPEDDEEDL